MDTTNTTGDSTAGDGTTGDGTTGDGPSNGRPGDRAPGPSGAGSHKPVTDAPGTGGPDRGTLGTRESRSADQDRDGAKAGRALPVLPTLRSYKVSWLAADAIAGLTLVAIAIPEQVATAHLANMAAVTGFYAFVAGSLLFALFGRHARMSVGADSTITPVFAAGVATLAVAGSPTYTHLVSATALMVGVLLVIAGLLRLGWIADFFPLPVVTGLLAGIGVEIFVKQLPTVLGLPGGGTTTIGRVKTFVQQLGDFNPWAFGIAVGVLAIIVVADKVDRRIPGALIGVVASTALVAAANLTSHGVQVLGPIEAQFPHLAWPQASFHQFTKLIVTALTVGFLCIVQVSATVRSSPANASGDATEPHRPEDFNVDLAAVGAGSLFAGLAGSFAVDASPPRTAVVGSAGGKSQVSSLVAVGAIVLVLAFATSLLKDLPEAALGAVLMFVASRLFHFGELRSVYRFGNFEFALALITLAIVVFVGIEQGVVAAALLALAERTRLAARPRDAVLGREPGTDHWIPTDVGRPTEQVPGVLVYLLYAPLWYGNATHVVDRVNALVASAPGPVRILVLDGNGVPDIDYTGAKALRELVGELEQEGIRVGIARASQLVHRDLRRAGLLDVIGPDRLFTSVDDAVKELDRPPSASTP
ncbi:MAG TPA: SulP family inorganic anion transporter [Acidimicrobiales bacterium]|nr:SulP family inorganic anion transporter [Acidimicrobiales bacterium]